MIARQDHQLGLPRHALTGRNSPAHRSARCITLLAVLMPLTVLLSGCGTLSLGTGGNSTGAGGRENEPLDLSGLDMPVDMPEDLDRGEEREKPVHDVQITKPFWMGKCPVTEAEYESVKGTPPTQRRSRRQRPRRPVVSVSWDDAVAFCETLTERERAGRRLPDGYEYRLPTEAEWEYCCRAGSTTEYCFGDGEAELGDYGWSSENAGAERHEVGAKRPNAWGMHDIHGNVAEWCLDWYDRDYYGKSEGNDPTGPPSGSSRVCRGGCGEFAASRCRSASRHSMPPATTYWSLGFRVVLAPSLCQ